MGLGTGDWPLHAPIGVSDNTQFLNPSVYLTLEKGAKKPSPLFVILLSINDADPGG